MRDSPSRGPTAFLLSDWRWRHLRQDSFPDASSFSPTASSSLPLARSGSPPAAAPAEDLELHPSACSVPASWLQPGPGAVLVPSTLGAADRAERPEEALGGSRGRGPPRSLLSHTPEASCECFPNPAAPPLVGPLGSPTAPHFPEFLPTTPPLSSRVTSMQGQLLQQGKFAQVCLD